MKEFNINMEGYNVNGVCVACLAHGRRMLCLEEIAVYFRILADIEVPTGVQVQLCWECAAAVQAVDKFSKLVQESYTLLQEYSRQNPFLNSPTDLSKHYKPRLSTSETRTLDFCNPPPTPTAEPLPEVIKEEQDDLKFEHIEVAIENKDLVKLELPPEFFFLDNSDQDSCQFAGLEADRDSASDDEKLSILSARKDKLSILTSKKDKVKKERKKRKKKKEGKLEKDKEKTSRSRDSKERRALQLKHYRKLNNLPSECVESVDLTEQDMYDIRLQDLAHADFVRLKYRCDDCVVGFATRRLMEEHTASKHTQTESTTSQCDICKIYFLTEDNMLVHRKLHLAGYRCVLCEFSTTAKHLMMRHVKREHRTDEKPPGEWPCSICNETFNTKSKLSYHRGVSHGERPQCDCCGKVFANKMTLKYHLKILPYDKSEKRSKEKLYLPCKGCAKVFHSRKSYRAHVVIHEGLEYPCPVCGKLFQWKRNLARHIRNHREKDTGTFYECRECDKRFSSKDCYSNHMKFSKKHVSEAAYGHACEHCGKRFPTRWCLVDHIDWDHFRKVKYECSYCLKAFKTAKIMVAHINNIHEHKKGREPDGEHLCDICGKSYKSDKRLKGHVWAMHTHRATAKTFKCKLCPATFTWQTSIYKHMKMMHSGSKQRKPASRLPLRQKRPDLPPTAHDIQHYFQPQGTQLVIPPAPIV